MSANDQGPDGANLFVFHIPNWCSNRQLFDLFTPHGSVISCRIFVDKISGRSRGFGFVSYDMRQGAQIAIEQMNGYELGHKRLKVEIKRSKRGGNGGYNGGSGGGGGGGGGGRDGGNYNKHNNHNNNHNNNHDSRQQHSSRQQHQHHHEQMQQQSNYMQTVAPDTTNTSTQQPQQPQHRPEQPNNLNTPTSAGANVERLGSTQESGETMNVAMSPAAAGASSVTADSSSSSKPPSQTNKIANDLSLRLWKAAGQGNLRLVSELFTDGADLNWQHPARDGQTAIHHACQFDQQVVTEWLVANGVDIHSVDHEGNTSLHIASMYGHAGLLRYLIAANGDINKQNDDQQTPMDLAKVYKKERTLRLLETLIAER
jgi:RNA recognition motif-containing protein